MTLFDIGVTVLIILVAIPVIGNGVLSVQKQFFNRRK